jgi:ABC-type uncharacterized transport system auxiliary subunit
MASTRARLAVFAVLIAVGWVGCASKPAPRDNFYRLSVAAPARLPSPPLAGALEVDRLRVEVIHQGRQMLYRDASLPNVIGQYSYHFWADPPGLMLQDQLVRYLRAAGVAQSVVTPGIHVDSQFVLKGHLVHMERHTGAGSPRIAVEIEFNLLAESGRSHLHHGVYAEERTVSGDGVGASVAAYDDALGAIFGRLVSDLQQR